MRRLSFFWIVLAFFPTACDVTKETDRTCEGSPPLASVQQGVCAGAAQVCVDGVWMDPDFNQIPGWEMVEQTCDQQDNDCDGEVDEGLTGLYYADRDADGWGDGGDVIVACTAPAGYVAQAGDCDDDDDQRHPGMVEVCDGRDNNCDGVADAGPCDANATCTLLGTNAYCFCDYGYDGDGLTCADIDECAEGIDYCSETATCKNTIGGYLCACPTGFYSSGLACDLDFPTLLVRSAEDGTIYELHPDNWFLKPAYRVPAADMDWNGENIWAVDPESSAVGVFAAREDETTWKSSFAVDSAYPEHIVLFNGEVLVSERDSGRILRYSEGGELLGSINTHFKTVHGMAVKDPYLYVAVYDGTFRFLRYTPGTFELADTLPMPLGLPDGAQILDFVYVPRLQLWFGLWMTGDAGALTGTDVIIGFTLKRLTETAVTLPFRVNAIGRGPKMYENPGEAFFTPVHP